MCGIVGVGSKIPFSDRSWLSVSRDTITHRGPDGCGEWWSNCGRIGLAHRRLSVIDLSPLGSQPMHYHCAGLSIVFNGEIYNFTDLRKELQAFGHKFKSHCDTEVLLVAYAQWGSNCLARLNGMFAFVIFDSVKQLLFFARDRAGEKPLFYRADNDTIVFASELKAILAHPESPRRINKEALDCYLAMGFVPGSNCILEGYNKLPPAHAMTFSINDAKLKVWRYWELPDVNTTNITQVDKEKLTDELEALLEDSVSKQLVADVPLGVLLSGGVDSSLITAMAARRSSKVCTFTVGFPGQGEFDETVHARLVAQHFGTEHIELMMSPVNVDILFDLVRQFDEPVADSSMLPTYLVSNLVRQHCTVALGGDGGDELFAGYNSYSSLLRINNYINFLPSWLRRIAANLASRALPIGFKGRNYLQQLDVDLNNGLPPLTGRFDSYTRRSLMSGSKYFPTVADEIYDKTIPRQKDLLQRATRMGFVNYLPDDILVKIDRSSMLNSLELRSPLLDYRLVGFAFSRVPSQLKATASEKKILLKKLAARMLPPEFDLQRKQGFSVPLGDWLRGGDFRNLFWDTLTDTNCMFDRKAINSMLVGQDKNLSNGERLFALVQLELWRKAYGVSPD